MSKILLANTHFEQELNEKELYPLEQALLSHPIYMQLQYLPFLSKEEEDLVAVTHPIDETFLKLLGDSPKLESQYMNGIILSIERTYKNFELISWGKSRQVKQWGELRELTYDMPRWEIIQEVNSKAFSFENSKKLENSRLISNQEELENYLSFRIEPAVFKTYFGTSGRGKLVYKRGQDLKALHTFLKSEWGKGRAVIGEPWKERLLDFSTQWHLNKDKIEYVGLDIFKNSPHGAYLGTWAGPENLLRKKFPILSSDLLDEHLFYSRNILNKILQKGYFGFVGIDAMIFLSSSQKISLHPIVEVNARQTMSLHALLFQRRWFPDKIIFWEFVNQIKDKPGLLPAQIILSNESTIKFSKQLYFRIE